MMEYDETTLKVAERVLERSDEIVRQRQIKTTKIRHISFAVSGFCAGIILCFGIFNLNQYIKESKTSLHNNFQNTTSNITVENTSTAISTTTVTETVNEITTILTSASTTETNTDTVTTSDIEETAVQSQPTETTENIEEDTEIVNTEAVESVITEKEEIVHTEAPTPQVTDAVTAVKPTLCGDVNGDKRIDIEDAVLIYSYVNNFEGVPWEEYWKKQGIKLDAEQALANADAYRPSDKREITSEDGDAVMGHINGEYPDLPINEL